MSNVRVVTWNLAEGSYNGHRDQMVCLESISQNLQTLGAELVLLNEVCQWNGFTYSGVDQIAWLAQHAGYPHVHFTKAAALALKGGKFVAVLSRTPLLTRARIEHSAYLDGGGYATLYVTASLNGQTHHIFSTRFTAWNVGENLQSHKTLRDFIAVLPKDEPVILGGDFNTAAPGDATWSAGVPRIVDFDDFSAATGLQSALGGVAWTSAGGGPDQLLFRGPYSVAKAEYAYTGGGDNPSDHPWVLADLALARQADWRWCNKCQGLYYGPGQPASRCAAGGPHSRQADSGSGNYTLLHNAAPAIDRQNGWRWCNRCQGLFYGPEVATSRCPAGSTHATPAVSGSGNYTLFHNAPPDAGRQRDWRYCSTCRGLFFGPSVDLSACPGGGTHRRPDQTGSGNYSIAHVAS